MSVFDLMVDGFPHGLPTGFEQGCRGAGECANHGTDLPVCRDAAMRYRSDYGYRKLVDQGMSPEQILELERAAVEAARPRVVAAKQARAVKAEQARVALVEKERVKAEKAAARKTARERVTKPAPAPAETPVAERWQQADQDTRKRVAEARTRLKDAQRAVSKAQGVLRGAVLLQVAAEQVLAAALEAQAAARPVKQEPKQRAVQPCGTNASYARGCRCEQCIEASRLYMREYRAKRQQDGPREESHGTAWGYAQGCRKRFECPGGSGGVKCADASLAAERERRRAAGVPAAPEMADSAPVAAHVRVLLDAGEAHHVIAERAQVSKSVVKALLYGRRDRPMEFVSAVNAERLLALVPVDSREMREQ